MPSFVFSLYILTQAFIFEVFPLQSPHPDSPSLSYCGPAEKILSFLFYASRWVWGLERVWGWEVGRWSNPFLWNTRVVRGVKKEKDSQWRWSLLLCVDPLPKVRRAILLTPFVRRWQSTVGVTRRPSPEGTIHSRARNTCCTRKNSPSFWKKTGNKVT